MAAPPASGVGNKPQAMWRKADVVSFWEELFDTDPDLAEELMFEKLLLDARAEQARRGWKGPAAKDDDAEEEQRRARVFQPWQLQAPGSAPPPLAPAVSRTVVMGLRAPPHLASKHERAAAAAAGARGTPEHVKKEPGA